MQEIFCLILKKDNYNMKNNPKPKVNDFIVSVESNLCDNNVINFAETATDMIQLYAKKNHDYGNSFEKGMEVIGIPYGIGRLYDKMNRIITLSKVKAEVNDESMLDTLIDLACYAVMTYNYLVKPRKLLND